jgi:hypothetical protein
MNESRQQPRQRTLKAGKIVLNHKSSLVDCTVRNLSQRGACLQVSSPIGIPERFEIVLDGVSRPCRVRWRSGRQIGIAF